MADKPDYRAFAQDMLKLCKKHGVEMFGYNEGHVGLGYAGAKLPKDFPYSQFSFSPVEVVIGDDGEKPITIRTQT